MSSDPVHTRRQGICSACGTTFSKIYVDLCGECMKDDDKRFALIRTYLKDNEGATINDISEATGLSRGDVARFESSGRLMRTGGGYSFKQDSCTCSGVGVRCEYCRKQLASSVIDEYVARNDSSSSQPGESRQERVFYTRRVRRLEEE